MNHGLLIFNLLVAAPVFAWEPQTGDIIFQVSRASQSRAIQLATHSDYSHTGIVVMRNSEPYVFEAIGPVAYTPLQKWIAQGKDGRYIVRRVRGGLSSPQQQKLKERYGKRIPLNETVISPQALFEAPQLETVDKRYAIH
ncbi:hypothetical protein FNI18_13840 [Salmonella enterica subsp. salamae]|nr:hypothetical protein [Salmonella enterica subsp. salamae]